MKLSKTYNLEVVNPGLSAQKNRSKKTVQKRFYLATRNTRLSTISAWF
jgi:hypothetical protein